MATQYAPTPTARVSEPSDVSGNSPTMLIKTWFAIGAFFLAFEGWVAFKWISAPTFGRMMPANGVTCPQHFLYAAYAVQVGMGLVWAWLIVTQIILPWIRTGAPKTTGLLGIAFMVIIFWDPSMNWIQQGCVYNPFLWNRGFLSNYIPGWMSPRGEMLPEPLLAWAGGYPGFLLWMTFGGLALMRFIKAKFPSMNNVQLMIAGIFGAMVVDGVCETLLIRFTGIYAYPGAIRSWCLFPDHWYHFPIYESIFFGGWVGLTSVLVYFKDDKGLTWCERGVEKLDMCKRSSALKALVRLVAVIGFVNVCEVIVYVLPMPLITANADPFPDDTPAYFTSGASMIGDKTGIANPRPDLPVIRRNDLEKFKHTPLTSNEKAMERVNSNYAGETK